MVGNVHVANPNIHEWFNTAAFAYAPYGTFGTAPSLLLLPTWSGLPELGHVIMKNWGLGESRRLQFRAEMFNTFNHPQFYAPQFGGRPTPVAIQMPSPVATQAWGRLQMPFPQERFNSPGNSIGDS